MAKLTELLWTLRNHGENGIGSDDIEAAADALASQEAEIAVLRMALEPFARLEIPKRPQGNAGFYSIFHDHIRAAVAALAKNVEG